MQVRRSPITGRRIRFALVGCGRIAAMDFRPSETSTLWLTRLQRFMSDLVLPSLPDWWRWADAGVFPLDVIEPLKAQARAQGLAAGAQHLGAQCGDRP